MLHLSSSRTDGTITSKVSDVFSYQLVILPVTDFQVGNFVTSWSLFSLSSTFRSYIGRDPSAVECLLCDFKLTKG